MKKVLLIALCFVAVYTAKCSHIVGGELFYNCTGNNVYQITLKLYRDCNCTNCAPYGNPEYVSVFDGQGNLYTQVAMPEPIPFQLTPTFTSSCENNPPAVCVQEADYTGTVMLPPSTTGYTIVYQRCCRNNGVVNLVAGQGATFTCEVPPTLLASCNNSARFNGLPPMYICLDAPLSIDYSANDPDGDSLVYSLCDPYDGASSACPDPSPNGGGGGGCLTQPNPPPYLAAAYNPPYNSANFTNSTSTINNLAIDPQSGLLTGIPNTAGLFDITVCVSEYRNGHLINTLRRDFQFTVAPCSIPIVTLPQVSLIHGIGVYTVNCKNYTVNFTNSSYDPSTTPLTFAWNFGVPGSTTDTSSASSPTFIYPDTGTYLVQLVASVPSGTGGICSDTATAYVYVYPTLTSEFTAPARCLDSALTFIDQSTSTSGLINGWLWNFGDGTSSNLQNPTHTYSTAGSYPVTLISDNVKGCKDTVTNNVTVYPIPAASFTDDSVICATSAEVLTNTSTGTISNYNWNFGALGTSTVESPTQVYNTAGNYTITLIDISPNGCKDTSSRNIVVNPLPVLTTSGNVTICPYASTQLSATGAVTYLWTPATGLSDSALANPVATPPPPNTITYTVTGTSQLQCSATSSLTISFFPVPHAYAGLDTSVCLSNSNFHNSVQLNASGGVSYQWSPAASLSNANIENPSAQPSANTTYTVTATDVNGCTATDTVVVIVLNPGLNLIVQDTVSICQRDTAYATILNQGSSGYGWNPSLFLTDDTSWNTGFYPPVTTTYTLQVTNYCYIKSDSLVIVVFPIPALGLPAIDSTCIGSIYQFNAQNAVTYQWNPNPTLSSTTIANPIATPVISTKYVVTGINQNGCVNKDSTFLLVYEPSTILVYPEDTPFICLGTSAPLRATGAYSYVWTPGATLTNANTGNATATPAVTTQYNVVATNIHGCKTADSLVIPVQMPPVAQTQSPFIACLGMPVQLLASGGPFYSWSPSAGLTDTTSNDPFALPDSTTSYTVKVFNDCFSSTAVAVVEIHPLPVVDAGPDTTIWRDTYAELHGTANTDTFFWNPSTGLDNALSLTTNASPQQTSWYYLFAIDQYGCENKDSVLITVIPHTELMIPTGFSPNGDGVNDVFKIARTLNIASLTEFAVFDRWGEKVFSTDNINEGWDGTRNGQPSPLGVYAWIVVAQTKDGQEVTKKGNVTLIR